MNAVARGLLTILVLWVIFYAAGSLVYYKNIKVNYTRKIGHFALFFLPIFMNAVFPATGEGRWAETVVWGLVLASFLMFVEPIRSRLPFIQRMFLAMDRPEDRPHTMRWFFIQILAALVAIYIGRAILRSFGYEELLILVPILVALGDGLAEPIGVRFGRHRYRAYALFSRQKYYRTLEGSATVFVATALVILFARSFFTPTEFLAALLIVPTIITLAEAISPHTIDTPLLHFFASVAVLAAKLAGNGT